MTPTVDDVLQRFASLRSVLRTLHTQALLEVDVTMPQAQLMYLVSSRPDQSMSAIAASLGVGLSAVTGLVDRLVEHGYVERRPDAIDRRQLHIALTPAGEAVLARMSELDATLLRQLLDGLEPDALTTIGAAIDLLVGQAAGLAAAPATDTPERTRPS